jgi:diguanylate cyclase (GGDEF)-like protein/PAS domain S-box-containing protein
VTLVTMSAVDARVFQRATLSVRHLISLLPKGRGLDEEMWARRHRVIVSVLAMTAVGLAIFGIARGYGVTHSILEASMLGAAALAAGQPRGPRRVRSAIAASGLMAASALLVHLWGGAIEGHFLFFVFVALLSVYQDWVPFLIALGFVVIHHGLLGVLVPSAVYDHADAIEQPWIWALIHGAFVLGAAAANTYGWLSSEEDHRRAAWGLLRSEATFRALFDRNPQPMWVYDAQTLEILSVNNAAVKHYGYSKDEFLAMRLNDIVVPEPNATLKSMALGDTDDGELGISKHRINGGRIISVIGHSDDLEFQGRDARVQVLMDVTERMGLEDELRYRALHDSLTGLGNRDLFRDRLEHALTRERGQASIAVATLDLDGFKAINDAHGHSVGDSLLVEVGHRIRHAIRPEDTAARMGGDEFSLLLEGVDTHHASQLVDRLQSIIGKPIMCDGLELVVTASVGIASGKGLTLTAADALRRADLAMYEAKAAGKGCQRVFRRGMQSTMLHRTEMAAELRGAVERGELFLEYQPLVDLRSKSAHGVEALVRWQHPGRGVVAPAEFIPVAEETGLINEIGLWVFKTACRQLAEWRRDTAWGAHISLAINVSPRQLREPSLEDSLQKILAATRIPAAQITVGVTETAVVEDIEQARNCLKGLRALGIKTAIDDFGSGYSSIGYLNTLPLDEIKLDRVFAGKLARGENKDLVVALVRLVDTLGVTTVIEGIETREEFDYACALGFDRGQGFYFARPVAPEQIPKLMGVSLPVGDHTQLKPGVTGVQVA